MFVYYEILQYYPQHLFTLFQTIRLHCIYKYVCSLSNSSILLFTICLLSSRLSNFTVYTNIFADYQIIQYYCSPSVYSLPDYQNSLYIQICSLIIKFFNIFSPLFIYSFSDFQISLYIQIFYSLSNSSIIYTSIINTILSIHSIHIIKLCCIFNTCYVL